MSAEVPLLVLSQVTKSYESASGVVPVLQGIDLDVAAGQTVAIVGPSGSGKSTLLHCIGGLDLPTEGTVRFKGQDQARWGEDDTAVYRNREIGFVFQQHHLLPQCTVLENAMIPALVHPDCEKAHARAVSLFEKVGMGSLMHCRPGRLSGGERQRAAVVRALVNRPSLLLADEPTGSLSESGAEDLTGLLLELNRDERMALIVVTHSMQVARRMDRVYVLEQGVLVQQPCPA
jgi:ABC-type lipoprotein export system ATPase subunit